MAIRTGTDHLFCTVYPGLHPIYDEIRIIRQFEIVIALTDQVHGNEVIHTLDVKKITGSPPPGRVLPFIITDKGIELSTTSRVV
jgi:KaiC/GvpD/RAD55 family RecA-like ATPase